MKKVLATAMTALVNRVVRGAWLRWCDKLDEGQRLRKVGRCKLHSG